MLSQDSQQQSAHIILPVVETEFAVFQVSAANSETKCYGEWHRLPANEASLLQSCTRHERIAEEYELE